VSRTWKERQLTGLWGTPVVVKKVDRDPSGRQPEKHRRGPEGWGDNTLQEEDQSKRITRMGLGAKKGGGHKQFQGVKRNNKPAIKKEREEEFRNRSALRGKEKRAGKGSAKIFITGKRCIALGLKKKKKKRVRDVFTEETTGTSKRNKERKMGQRSARGGERDRKGTPMQGRSGGLKLCVRE